jgi:hypothetical protein
MEFDGGREMRLPFRTIARGLLVALVSVCLIGAGCGSKQKVGAYYPGSLTLVLPNYSYVMSFTATSQTVTQSLTGLGSATIQLSGTASAATVQCKGTPDGTNYYALDYSDGTITATYNTVKAIAGTTWSYSGTPTIYYTNLTGSTGMECVTSSTFTGALLTVTIVASSNRGIF